MVKKGMVYLVGAGPGDKELITVKGLRLLRDCEVVVYDRLASAKLLEEVSADCEKINVGKRVGQHVVTQEEINRILVEKGLAGKRVVRLKGGDPFVFGRGGEEIIALSQAQIPYEVVPGISSSIAAATYAGIPVTHRGISSSFHVITGYTLTTANGVIDNFHELASLKGTLIFLMGMGHLEEITQGLIKEGKAGDTPVAIISRGTTWQQRTVKGSLSTICKQVKEEKIEAPAVIIVGEVTTLDFLYKGKESLIGVNVGIVGTAKLTHKLGKLLEREGARVEKLGITKLKVDEEHEFFDQLAKVIKTYQWVVFTSTYAVCIFFDSLKRRAIDYRLLGHLKFAVIGKGTQDALKEQGFVADYMPTQYTAIALGEGLSQRVQANEKILIPRAKRGSEELVTALKKQNCQYVDMKIYDVVIDQEALETYVHHCRCLDYLVFASSSGVESLLERGGPQGIKLVQESQVVCLGEITARTLEAKGYSDCIVADTFTVEGVTQKIVAHHQSK